MTISAAIPPDFLRSQTSQHQTIDLNFGDVLSGDPGAFSKLKLAAGSGDQIAIDALHNLCFHQDNKLSRMAGDALISAYTDKTTGPRERNEIGLASLLMFEVLSSRKNEGVTFLTQSNDSTPIALSLLAGVTAKSKDFEGCYQNIKPKLQLMLLTDVIDHDPLDPQRFVHACELNAYIADANFQRLHVADPITTKHNENIQKLLLELQPDQDRPLVVPVFNDEHWSALIIDAKAKTITCFDSNHDGQGVMPFALSEDSGFTLTRSEHDILQNPDSYAGNSPAMNGCAAFVVEMMHYLDAALTEPGEPDTALSTNGIIDRYYAEAAAQSTQTEQEISHARIKLLYAGLKAERAISGSV